MVTLRKTEKILVEKHIGLIKISASDREDGAISHEG